MADYKLTERQVEANQLLAGPATHCMLYGGSRSGKTFLLVRAICLRALRAPRSRHLVLRYRLNHLRASIWHDTWPKVLALCFPGVEVKQNKSELYAEFPNKSQVWFGGLDDSDRVEKILGQEYATIFLNECSQISFDARSTAVTRLAQRVKDMDGAQLPLKCYYDENPPTNSHWTYRLFELKQDPDTREPLPNPQDYVSLAINPIDNQENLPPDYLDTLGSLPARHRRRFLYGQFAESNPNALFDQGSIDKWRHLDGELPDLQRIVIGVDPSGASDDESVADDIGIVVAGLGTDGKAYILEDLTLNAGPSTWAGVAVAAYNRHQADKIVAEKNFGGAMVESVLRAAMKDQNVRAPVGMVTASRGKVVRAEPISALYEQGLVRHAGFFHELEDELSGFSTTGYTGTGSPNRADALVWAVTELFPGLVSQRKDPKPKPRKKPRTMARDRGWMAA